MITPRLILLTCYSCVRMLTVFIKHFYNYLSIHMITKVCHLVWKPTLKRIISIHISIMFKYSGLRIIFKLRTSVIINITISLWISTLHTMGGHGGRVVTLSPPTSEARVRFLAQPQVGKLVVACRWSAVYGTEP